MLAQTQPEANLPFIGPIHRKLPLQDVSNIAVARVALLNMLLQDHAVGDDSLESQNLSGNVNSSPPLQVRLLGSNAVADAGGFRVDARTRLLHERVSTERNSMRNAGLGNTCTAPLHVQYTGQQENIAARRLINGVL